MIEIQKIRTGRKSGEEKGGELSENGERGAYLGSPHHLKEKIAKTRDGKREKTKEIQTKRREDYLLDRKKGVKKDRQMEESKEESNLASVQVKKSN